MPCGLVGVFNNFGGVYFTLKKKKKVLSSEHFIPSYRATRELNSEDQNQKFYEICLH